jgi:hypothetical protein
MGVAMAIILSLGSPQAGAAEDLSALESADRAVIARARGGVLCEIKDPAVLKILRAAMARDEGAPAAGEADWTLTFFKGGTAVGELQVLPGGEWSIRNAAGRFARKGSSARLAELLRDQERIDPLSRDLGSDAYETRVRATRELIAIGRPALEAMKKLSESCLETEVRSRAVQIVKEIREALRPRLAALFVGGRKDKGAAAKLQIDEWIHDSAADQGYPTLSDVGLGAWSEVLLTRTTLFPANPGGKPGGIYVYGQVVEWNLDGTVEIEITSTMKSWKSGRFVLDVREPRKLIRLSDQGTNELFLALKIQEGAGDRNR